MAAILEAPTRVVTPTADLVRNASHVGFSGRAPALPLLAAAPHRLLFFIGAANVLMAMAWWALWLVALRWQVVALPQPRIPGGYLHAIIMQYQVLTPFIFGFLLTVFPRWMGLPALTRWHYVPVGLGLFGGQLLTLVGLWGVPHLVFLGLVQTLAGWTAGLFFLIALLRRESGCTWHARSCAAALALGWLGLVLILAYLYTNDPRLVVAAIKLGSFGLLLPVYFTVNHRMTPFFASVVVPGYVVRRPMAALAAFWALALAHLALELGQCNAWLWLPDLPLAGLTAWLLWQWWPRAPDTELPALLRVLFIGFAWLPIAFLLYAGQSVWLAGSGEFVLGRAPAHALFIGYFGSLLVAMVTRVTQGHSGRPLELGRVAAFAFAAVQLVALLRIGGEVTRDPIAWQVVAAFGWLLAFLPWVLRSGWIYLTPRADGKAEA